MTTAIQLYNDILHKVRIFYKQLKLDKLEKTTGRTLAVSITETIALALFKQTTNIATKKAIFNIFQPPCSYKTLVVNMNRFALFALLIFNSILKLNRRFAHPIKHTDSTDVPVCLNKNAKAHKTMRGLADWGHSGKGLTYQVKLYLTTDLHQRMLAVKFTAGNVHGTSVFMNLNKDLLGLFVADAEFISQTLSQEFHVEGKRILYAKPRKNMKKLISAFDYHLYNTRVGIEPNFRNLKLFYGLVTSLPRSVGAYLANYVYSLLAYQFA